MVPTLQLWLKTGILHKQASFDCVCVRQYLGNAHKACAPWQSMVEMLSEIIGPIAYELGLGAVGGWLGEAGQTAGWRALNHHIWSLIEIQCRNGRGGLLILALFSTKKTAINRQAKVQTIQRGL